MVDQYTTGTSWLGRLRESLSGRGRQRLNEQYMPSLYPYSAGASEDEYAWRGLSDNLSFKDLVPSAYLDIHYQAYEAYHANPLAFAIIETTTSFVLGRGVKLDASHPHTQRVLDDFWRANQMDERVYAISNELALYGELFVRYFVNRFDGGVRVRLTDPSLIDQVECDPEDIETPLRFHRRPLDAAQDDNGTWFRSGDEMQHFAINKVSNAQRGSSDLAPLLPWLRRYKDWLTDRVRINKFKGAFLWDVTMRGADSKAIEMKRMEYMTPPPPGSILIHNENEHWQAVQPAINASDAKEDGRALRLLIAAGAGLPEHFLADGDNGNRATAAEMGMPTLLKFQRRQRVVKHILRSILDRVLAEARHAGRLDASLPLDYDIVFPEIDLDDNQQLATAANTLVQALIHARSQGWLSDETAMRLLFKFAGEDVSVHEELARIRKEQEQA